MSSPVTEEVINQLMEKLALLVPPELAEIAKVIPENVSREKVHVLMVKAAMTEAETGTYAGMLALIGAGLKEDGSVQLSEVETAMMVKEAVEFLIAKGVT